MIIILIIVLIIGLIISATCYGNLLNKYKKYSKIESEIGLPSVHVAERLINCYNLPTTIALTDGHLTDAYVVKKDVVVLSKQVASGSSVADISIACHEIGHAMQKNDQSAWLSLQLLFKLLSNIAKFFLPITLIVGIILLFFPSYQNLALILFYVSFGLWLTTFLFKIILIPLELDASKRAYKILKENNILTKKELKGCKKVLNAAALTYVGGIFVGLYKFWLLIKKSFRRY